VKPLLASNLGQIVGRLHEQVVESASIRRHDLLKGSTNVGRIRRVLLEAGEPLFCRQIAARTGLSVVKVASAVVSMRDVERSGVCSKYRYSLKAPPP
jgi:hypothetical protein